MTELAGNPAPDFFPRNQFGFAAVHELDSAQNLLIPFGFDGLVRRAIEAVDQRTRQGSAFFLRKFQGLFQ